MPDPNDSAKHREADAPTRLQRIARRGCAGVAYAIVLVPLVLVIWFFSSIPRGFEQFGELMWKIVSEGPPGADTEIIVVNLSGRDVREFEVRVADHRIRVDGLLEAERKGDPDQKAVHYRDMIFSRVRPLIFPLEIVYRDAATDAIRAGSALADRRPRGECQFVIFLRTGGPEFSECRRPEREGLSVR